MKNFNIYFFHNSPFLKLPEFGLNADSLLAQNMMNNLSKVLTTCFRGSFVDIIFCVDWISQFSKILKVWAKVFCISGQKTRAGWQLVKHAHYVSGGAFRGILSRRKPFQKLREKIRKKTPYFVPKSFVTFEKFQFSETLRV